jgi:putative ABC transport system ATP-binding protein
MLLTARDLDFRHATGGGCGPLSFTLDAGEALLVLGPSGSGKTTLVNLVAGLIRPQGGTLELAGEPLHALSGAAADALRRRTTAIIFQSLRLVSALSVRDNLALARRLAGRPPDVALAHDLLSRLGIAGRGEARPRDLSQGEAQRAAIARALVAEPRLLIADEPTSALDDSSAGATATLLLEAAQAQGAALMIVTHDARLAAHFGRALRLGPDGREVR